MNNIIAASSLARKLAAATGITDAQAESFIREYFATIHHTLSAGENVTVKYLGTFTLTGDAANPIIFDAAPEIKQLVNAPFEMFEPVPLNDGEMESDTPAEPEPIYETVTGTIVPPVPPVKPATQPVPPVPPTPPQPQSDDTQNQEPQYQEPHYQEPHYDESQYQEPWYYPEEERPGFFHRGPQLLWWLIGLLMGLLIGFAIAYCIFSTPPTVVYAEPLEDESVTHIEKVEITDSVQADEPNSAISTITANPEPAISEPTYDTITRTVYLTSLARRYYGQMEYWVYIYDANPGLGNPNKIKPGTRVVIPDKSTLPLTGDSERDIAAAKKRSAEIYANYKN